MKIIKKWLEQNNACAEGIEWFTKQKENNAIILIEKLLLEDHFDWANWSICRILGKDNKIRYAIHAAKLVLHIFEDKYPGDKRPRKAIESANNYLNSNAAYAAYAYANAASAAAYAADAYAAADAAAAAAYAYANAANAAYVASVAAYAASAAFDAAHDAFAAAFDAAAAAYAADAAAYAADAADADSSIIKNEIIDYGINLLKGELK